MMLDFFTKDMIDIKDLAKEYRLLGERKELGTSIDNDFYFIKYCNSEPSMLNELVGSYLASYLDINNSTLKIFKEENKRGILYKYDLSKDYCYGNVLNEHKNNLYDFIKSIYNKYHDISLVNDLLKLVILDVFMGNPCRFKHTLLFSKQEDSLKLESVTGFNLAYLNHNDLNHSSGDALDFQDKYGELYKEVIKGLKDLKERYPYVNEVFNKMYNMDIREIILNVENIYDISVPSYLVYRSLNHDYEIKKLIREKIL